MLAYFSIGVQTDWSEEIDINFMQHMANAMGMSYYKYGAVRDAYPHKIAALESMERRIEKYKETGNKQYLVDAANFAMIEFMAPIHPNAHYTPEDSNTSPGRKFHGEVDFSTRGNKEI